MPARLQDSLPWCRFHPRELDLTRVPVRHKKQRPVSRRSLPMKRLVPFCLAFAFAAHADEGMWTLDNFPAKKVRHKYGFSPDAEWLQEARLASVRLAGGCSGSFVSPEGLVMTNHHCSHSCIEQLSTKEKDFVAEGFYAPTLEKEVKCPEIELNELIQIGDVTARVQGATKGLKPGKEFNDKRKAVMASIEKECAAGNDKLRCDVVELYHGGQYSLYKYKRFQDVRLVFAPEVAIAFFGGDPDNFNFPRYDLDVSFLRAYEDDKPARTEHYFKWSPAGAKEGDLTFVSGHPGGTDRELTMAARPRPGARHGGAAEAERAAPARVHRLPASAAETEAVFQSPPLRGLRGVQAVLRVGEAARGAGRRPSFREEGPGEEEPGGACAGAGEDEAVRRQAARAALAGRP